MSTTAEVKLAQPAGLVDSIGSTITHSDGIPVVKVDASTPIANGNAAAKNPFLPATYYDNFLSNLAKARRPSPIRSLLPLEFTPGLISLLAGKPNPNTFPFTSISFDARSPFDPSKSTTLTISPDILDQSLQYGPTSGLPLFQKWVLGLQEREHGRTSKDEGWRVSIGSGSQDLIYKAVTALTNPGDAVFIEKPVYAGVLPMFQSLHCEMVEVPTDANGIRSDMLRSILENWAPEKPKPKVLYTVPYGCNPTGTTATLERRKETLKLAEEHDFLILEDDPYYYLYYGEGERPPSYFSLELEEEEVGRVLRFDSLSKILSAGMRIGFATGPEPLLAAMDRHTSTANLQAPSLSQAMAYTLMESWGYDGFKAHTQYVSQFYRERRDIFERALKKHLSGLAEWSTPYSGMFVWFKLLLTKEGDDSEGDSEHVIRTKAVEKGVLALPGTVFMPNGGVTAYVRVSFSLLDEDTTNEALRRLREVVLEARGDTIASNGNGVTQ